MSFVAPALFLFLGWVFVPVTYFVLCLWMVKRGACWLCYPAYFFLFGIIGGAFIALGLSPSGLAAICVLFLVTAAPVGCLCASVGLHLRRARGRFENVAMVLGYAYSGIILAPFLFGQLIN